MQQLLSDPTLVKKWLLLNFLFWTIGLGVTGLVVDSLIYVQAWSGLYALCPSTVSIGSPLLFTSNPCLQRWIILNFGLAGLIFGSVIDFVWCRLVTRYKNLSRIWIILNLISGLIGGPVLYLFYRSYTLT